MLNESQALVVLAALAQGTRLEISRTLLRHLPEGLAAGCLADEVGCAPSTLSFHVQHLGQAGLVRSHRQAQSIVYFAVPDMIGGLSAFLTSECCRGHPELCALSADTGVSGKAGCGCGDDVRDKPAA